MKIKHLCTYNKSLLLSGTKKTGIWEYNSLQSGLDKKAHSFFGLMYLKLLSGQGEIETFPKNP